MAERGLHQVDKLDPEVIDAYALGDDEAHIERELQPPAYENQPGNGLLPGTMESGGVRTSAFLQEWNGVRIRKPRSPVTHGPEDPKVYHSRRQRWCRQAGRQDEARQEPRRQALHPPCARHARLCLT